MAEISPKLWIKCMRYLLSIFYSVASQFALVPQSTGGDVYISYNYSYYSYMFDDEKILVVILRDLTNNNKNT